VGFWGQLIFQLRTEKDMLLRELAIRAQVNRSTLRRIEEGASNRDITMIKAVLAVLGYELEAMAQQNGSPAQVRVVTAPAARNISKFEALCFGGHDCSDVEA
jgi:transcriptional regulator with XRE-family HTH domain